MGSPRDPKIAPNRKKSCSRGLPESTLKKVTKNYAFWVPSRPQNIGFRAIGVSKIKKSPVTKNDLKMTSKCLPFWMLLAPKITTNQKKHRLKKTLKITSKKYRHMSQKGTVFWPGKVTKIIKIRALGSKCAPSLQEGFPGTQNTQKSSKNELPGLQNHSKS